MPWCFRVQRKVYRQPLQGTIGVCPGGGIAAHILLSLVFSSHRDVRSWFPQQLLPAEKVKWHMAVGRLSLFEQVAGFHTITLPAVGDQRAGVTPFGRAFL